VWQINIIRTLPFKPREPLRYGAILWAFAVCLNKWNIYDAQLFIREMVLFKIAEIMKESCLAWRYVRFNMWWVLYALFSWRAVMLRFTIIREEKSCYVKIYYYSWREELFICVIFLKIRCAGFFSKCYMWIISWSCEKLT